MRKTIVRIHFEPDGIRVKFTHGWKLGNDCRYYRFADVDNEKYYRPTKSSLARLVGIMFEREGMECAK